MTKDAPSMNLSQAIADIMAMSGAKHIFTLTGGPQEPLIEANRRHGIKPILARSERSAFAMADAYARMTGKPTFGTAQAGCGTSALPFGMVDAYWAKSPVIAINSAANSSTALSHDYQELDQIPSMRPVTKWCEMLPSPDRIFDVLPIAIRAALSGNAGPTYLGIPMDWYTRDVNGNWLQEFAISSLQSHACPADPDDACRAAQHLASAERPVILAGGGILAAHAWDRLTDFARRFGIPVATTMSGKGAFPETDALALGVSGRYGRSAANAIIAESDCVLAIGTRMGSMGTDSFACPTRDCRIVHIDIEQTNFGRTYPNTVALLADANAGLEVLQSAMDGVTQKDRTSWLEAVRGAMATWRRKYKAFADTPLLGGRLNPVSVMQVLDATLKDDVIVSDTGYMAAWAATLMDQHTPGRQHLRAAGSLGWAFPGAMGAKLATGNDRHVVCITGDGGLGYHLADLETACRLNLPTVTIVMNNAGFGFSYDAQRQGSIGNACLPEITDFEDNDFCAIARAFGAHGETVTDLSDLQPAIERSKESGRPAILDVKVSREIGPPVARFAESSAHGL